MTNQKGAPASENIPKLEDIDRLESAEASVPTSSAQGGKADNLGPCGGADDFGRRH